MTSETEEQMTRNLQSEKAEAGGVAAARAVGETMGRVDAVIGRFGEIAHAEACVGPAQAVNGHTVIPLASVNLQAAFGMGFGGGEDPNRQGRGSGGGSGLGGRGSSRVIALVDVSEQEVKVRPVPDVTAITMAMMALLGIAVIALRGRPGGSMLRFLRQG